MKNRLTITLSPETYEILRKLYQERYSLEKRPTYSQIIEDAILLMRDVKVIRFAKTYDDIVEERKKK